MFGYISSSSFLPSSTLCSYTHVLALPYYRREADSICDFLRLTKARSSAVEASTADPVLVVRTRVATVPSLLLKLGISRVCVESLKPAWLVGSRKFQVPSLREKLQHERKGTLSSLRFSSVPESVRPPLMQGADLVRFPLSLYGWFWITGRFDAKGP